MITIEKFKSSPIFPHNYLIGDKGTVVSLFNGAVRKQGVNKYGYPYVNLWNGGKSKNTTIHRLVALAFIPKIEGKDIVNHMDGNKLNNDVNNLEWCTVQENTIHSYALGLQKPMKGEKHGRAKYKKEQIILVCELLEKGILVKEISEQTNVPTRTIQSIRAGHDWTSISINYVFKDRRFKDRV